MLFWSLFLLPLLIRESQSIDTPIKPESKNNSGDVIRTVFEDMYVCPTENKTCNRYKSLNKTKDLACYSSKDCDLAFVCCPDSCYKHRICKHKTELVLSTNPLRKKSVRMADGFKRPPWSPFELVDGKVETCPRERSPCAKPQDAKKTERFKCVDQCPLSYKCCDDSCFAHKICKKANVTITKIYVQIPKHRINHSDSELTTTTTMKPFETTQKSNESEVTTEKPVTTTHTQQDGECPAENLICSSPLHENDTKQFDCDKTPCPKDFFCCKDNCFTHKICKELSSSNGSTIRFSRKREVCPTDEESCLLPADIKHAVFCAKANCTSGLKCCPDACFKRNVCKRPDIIIETTIESCPEEPKVCDSFLRNVTIHPRFICSANMSNCPEDTKCCSDSCHQADLCKKPDLHTVVQKLVPTTTYQEESQTPGNKSGASNINDSQTPGNKPDASKINNSPSPGGNAGATASQPANGSQPPGGNAGATANQPANGSQPPGGNAGATASQPANGAQPPGGNAGATASQPANGSQPPGGNAGATANQPANGAQPPVSNPGASTGQLVTASPNTTYKDDLQSPDSHESAESPDDHMLT